MLARSYGFDSWPKLKAYTDGVTAGRLCEVVERDDVATVRDMLARRPEIVNLEWPGHGEHRALHVAVLRRDVQFRYRWALTLDAVVQLERDRINGDPAFAGPKPAWA